VKEQKTIFTIELCVLERFHEVHIIVVQLAPEAACRSIFDAIVFYDESIFLIALNIRCSWHFF
jgi:hypothetical protein